MPEPRRKDEGKNRPEPADGKTDRTEEGQPPEEYTSYRQVDPEEESAETAEAEREADLQPGTPKGRRPGRESEEGA